MLGIANKTCTEALVPCLYNDPSFLSSIPNALVISDQGDVVRRACGGPRTAPRELVASAGWSNASQSLSAPIGTGRITVRVVHPGSIPPRATVTLSKSPKGLD